jgi:HAD superfamily hydrolase (TIGR01509 family)
MNLPRAILFDMDGTITEPMLDFAQIRLEMGIGQKPILEALAEMEPGEAAVAREILERHEERVAENSNLNPGCDELFEWIAAKQLPIALVTRNSRQSAMTVLARHKIAMRAVISREDGPYKPSPAALHLACEKLGVRAEQTWMVGDGQYDIEAGAAAGMPTVWLSHGKARHFAAEPWKTVRDLREFLQLLQGGQRCEPESRAPYYS